MKKIIGIIIVTLLIGTTISQVSACIDFTVSEDETILIGANHDWSPTFNVYMHFFPAEEGKYGRVIFEFNFPLQMDLFPDDPDWMLPKQGMNDQGLYFDLLYTPDLIPVNSKDKSMFDNDDPDYYQYGLWAYCLAKCSTVSEVLEIFNQYNLEPMSFFQAFFVDKYGDSVIIEGDDIIYREGDFQVVTNFLQSHPELGGYPCERYETAVSMIENMADLSDEYFRSICNATHVESTVFSNVYDLTNEIFYVNYYHNYKNTVEFDLNEELAKGKNRIYLGSFFEPEGNQGPGKPDVPTGIESGTPSEVYSYRVRKVKDPDDDLLSYKWDWGDGTYSLWIAASPYGSHLSVDHNWTEEGTYEVHVKAMDMYGCEGEWSDPLVVSMPKTKSINDFNPWIIRLIQRFPILELLI